MYKQCFELLTAQGTNPQKTFTVVNGSQQGELKKDFDNSVKGNVFQLDGHKIILPASSSSNDSKSGQQQTGTLNLIHRFLIFQIYVSSGDPLSIELHIKDKTNTRRRIMFTEGSKEVVTNAMHARIPNSLIKRNQWLNLCIDIQSFTNECFVKYLGGGTSMTPGQVQNIYKTLEQIQVEGHLKIRKIFTMRSQIPVEFGDHETIDQSIQVEAIPKNIDYNANAQSVNQVISYEKVQQYLIQQSLGGIEDSMMITGLQLQNKTQNVLYGQKKAKGVVKKIMSHDSTNKKGNSNQDLGSGLATLTADSSFRHNKFGVSNKTCESFQPQKGASTTSTNQTTQSNTVYSVRTTSSKRQVGNVQGNNGMQSSQSPFQKQNNLTNKRQYNSSVLEIDDAQQQNQHTSKTNSRALNNNSSQKNVSVPPPQNRQGPLSNSQNRKQSPRDASQTKQSQFKPNNSQHQNNTRNLKGFNLVNQNNTTTNSTLPTSTVNSTPNQKATINQNTINGFQEVHETTIVEENETVIPSERIQNGQYKSIKEVVEEKKEPKQLPEIKYDRFGVRIAPRENNKSHIKAPSQSQNPKDQLTQANKNEQYNIEDSLGIIGNSLSKLNKNSNPPLAKKGIINNNAKVHTKQHNSQTSNKRQPATTVNSAVKIKQQQQRNTDTKKAITRKFSTGEDISDDDAFRNRTLRFTNNNFVGKARDNSNNRAGGVEGWDDQQNKNSQDSQDNNSDKLYESIEEEIITSAHQSPQITAKKKQKDIDHIHPRPPRHQQQSISDNKMKVDTMTNFNQNKYGNDNDDLVNNGDHDQIDEDINATDVLETDGDLYQVPISGGIPIKMAMDNARRPFTPPFSQIIKMQQTNISRQSTQRKEEISKQHAIEEEINIDDAEQISPRKNQDTDQHYLQDSLEGISQNVIEKKNQKQLMYDSKLNCYYDPDTKEYFELRH